MDEFRNNLAKILKGHLKCSITVLKGALKKCQELNYSKEFIKSLKTEIEKRKKLEEDSNRKILSIIKIGGAAECRNCSFIGNYKGCKVKILAINKEKLTAKIDCNSNEFISLRHLSPLCSH